MRDGVVGRIIVKSETVLVVERYWEGRPEKVTVLYTKPIQLPMRT